MIPFKKFMNKIPKPVRKIGGGLSAASFGLEFFNQGKRGSFTDNRMNELENAIAKRTNYKIQSNPNFNYDTDIGKKSGEYIAKKLKPQQIKGRQK